MYPSSLQALCVTGDDKEMLKPQARRWVSPAACKLGRAAGQRCLGRTPATAASVAEQTNCSAS